MAESGKQKILRLGVIRGGKIIEEKLIRKRVSVTVGTGTKNNIVLPTTNAPKAYTLFELRGNDYYLVFTDQMSGRMSVGDKAADLQSLKAQNLVRKHGNSYYLKLSDVARGRVSVGECIILFQFVNPPPEPVRPQLPSIVRGYWLRNIDWPYTSTFGVTILVMLIIMIWAKNVPLPKEVTIEDIPDKFAKMIIPDKPEEEETSDEADGAGEKKKEPVIEKKAKDDEPESEEPSAEEQEAARKKAAAAKRAKMEKKVAGRGLLKVLGAKGPGGVAAGGAVADVFGEGGIAGSGDGAFDGIGGLDVATAAGQKGQRGMDGAATATSIADIGTKGVVGKAGKGRGKSEARVVARVSSAALQEFDSDSRSQSDIVKVIKRRIGGIKHCYEKRLKRDPELRGKIVISFVIHPGGKVIEVEVASNTTGDSELAECIASRVKSIRFPATDGSETSVTYPFILAPGG
jgi:outer membrane biosynthesis protein TonB